MNMGLFSNLKEKYEDAKTKKAIERMHESHEQREHLTRRLEAEKYMAESRKMKEDIEKHRSAHKESSFFDKMRGFDETHASAITTKKTRHHKGIKHDGYVIAKKQAENFEHRLSLGKESAIHERFATRDIFGSESDKKKEKKLWYLK